MPSDQNSYTSGPELLEEDDPQEDGVAVTALEHRTDGQLEEKGESRRRNPRQSRPITPQAANNPTGGQ